MDELNSKVGIGRLQKNGESKNIQIVDLISAMAMSEPCLFNNSEKNLMPVTEGNFVKNWSEK